MEVISSFMALYMIYLNFIINRDINKKIGNLFKHINQNTKDQNEWLFKSLYTIDHGVKKPLDKTENVKRKAVIYNPNKDPMSEFKGTLDDYSLK